MATKQEFIKWLETELSRLQANANAGKSRSRRYYRGAASAINFVRVCSEALDEVSDV